MLGFFYLDQLPGPFHCWIVITWGDDHAWRCSIEPPLKDTQSTLGPLLLGQETCRLLFDLSDVFPHRVLACFLRVSPVLWLSIINHIAVLLSHVGGVETPGYAFLGTHRTGFGLDTVGLGLDTRQELGGTLLRCFSLRSRLRVECIDVISSLWMLYSIELPVKLQPQS